MSSISIKGIAIGVVAGLVASIVFGIVVVVAAIFGPSGEMVDADVLSMGPVQVVIVAVSAAIMVAAGYLAAKIAGKGQLINGALTGLVCAVLGLLAGPLQGSEITLNASSAIQLVSAPALGLIGGRLRVWRVRAADR